MLAFGLILLVIGSEVKLTLRDAAASLSGAVNSQVVFELGLWAVGGALVFGTVSRGGRRLAALDLRSDLGSGLSVLIAIAIASWLMSYSGPAAKLTFVKASQLVALAMLSLWAFRWLRVDPERMRIFWIATRRLVWITALILTILTAVIPSWGNGGALVATGEQAGYLAGPDDAVDAGRYAWAVMHPITTGGLIGLTLLLLLGAMQMSHDPSMRSGRAKALGTIALIALFSMLLATKSRGPLVATVLSVLAMSFVTRSRSNRAYIILGVATGAAVIASGVLGPLWRTAVTRGESSESLRTLTGREQIFARAIELFKEQPISGHGYLSGRHIFFEWIPWAGESHNAIVEIAVSLGLIGLLLYALLFSRVVGYAIRRAGSSIDGVMASEALPLLVFILTTGVVGEGFAGAVGFETLMLVWAILLTDVDRWNLRRSQAERRADAIPARWYATASTEPA